MEKPKHYMLIACAVLYRECYYSAAISKNIIDIKLCEKGLHDIGAAKMSTRLQSEIDDIDPNNYDAILLAYGLCSNGTMGLRSKIPIVLPRAHDCITLLMGSKEKYQQYFNQNTGTFYRSSGWIERGTSSLDNPESTVSQMGISTYQEYVEKYGEDNAKYLMETLGSMAHYNKLAYIAPLAEQWWLFSGAGKLGSSWPPPRKRCGLVYRRRPNRGAPDLRTNRG